MAKSYKFLLIRRMMNMRTFWLTRNEFFWMAMLNFYELQKMSEFVFNFYYNNDQYNINWLACCELGLINPIKWVCPKKLFTRDLLNRNLKTHFFGFLYIFKKKFDWEIKLWIFGVHHRKVKKSVKLNYEISHCSKLFS